MAETNDTAGPLRGNPPLGQLLNATQLDEGAPVKRATINAALAWFLASDQATRPKPWSPCKCGRDARRCDGRERCGAPSTAFERQYGLPHASNDSIVAMEPALS